MFMKLGVAGLVLVGTRLGAQDKPKAIDMRARHDSGFLVFQSDDGAFKYWLDGRVQLDAAAYTGGQNELGSGSEVRRARIGIKTVLYRNWYGEIDVDFAGNAIEMKDMWLGYEGLQNSLIKVGNFKEPFSLETLTSSKNITFMERSYVDNFSPDRNLGVSVTHWGRLWQASLGAFQQPAGDVDASAANEATAVTGRVTFAPVLADRRLLHVGLAASRRTPDAGLPADAHQMRFRARPETDVSLARFLTTGKIKNVDFTFYNNAELAMVAGPVSVQAEGTRVSVHRRADLETATFDGGYAYVSWFLTGESRQYLVDEGEFDRVYPKSAQGAWELAARISTMNLNDFSPDVNIKGGKATNYTLGVNWYINPNFKWMLNYTRVINDINAKPDLGVAPFVPGDKFNIFQMRFALAL
jgi:phosphate-selective porin OprO/OprP